MHFILDTTFYLYGLIDLKRLYKSISPKTRAIIKPKTPKAGISKSLGVIPVVQIKLDDIKSPVIIIPITSLFTILSINPKGSSASAKSKFNFKCPFDVIFKTSDNC